MGCEGVEGNGGSKGWWGTVSVGFEREIRVRPQAELVGGLNVKRTDGFPLL